MMMKPINITATTLDDAWHQLVFKCVEEGRRFTIDRGSYAGQVRCEFDFVTVHITHPWAEKLLPQVRPFLGIPNPVDDEFLDQYLPYLMTDAEAEGESYTYGQRICGSNVLDVLVCDIKFLHDEFVFDRFEKPGGGKDPGITPSYDGFDSWYMLNQLDYMIWTYKTKGWRSNQMILQVGQPSDMLLKDPPCLRHIDTRIQDGALHFYPYFRSWDLYSGFPANLAAIELMKQYCASEIGVKNGEIIATSKGLHLYDYVFEITEAIRNA
jgi:thymidylate synthase